MVTNAEERPPEPTRTDKAAKAARIAIAGHPQAAIRRIVLYLLTIVLLVSPFPHVAILPLALLGFTDSLA